MICWSDIAVVVVCSFGILLSKCKCDSVPVVDDSVLYSVKWMGTEDSVKESTSADAAANEVLIKAVDQVQASEKSTIKNVLSLLSADNERYKCVLPEDDTGNDQSHQTYTGPSAEELIDSIHQMDTCSYRIEQYWTYELCHGKFLRQYHEEKDAGQKVKLQEYFLGRYPKGKLEKSADVIVNPPETSSVDSITRPQEKLKVKKVDNVDIVYYPVNYTEGTHCDLNQNPRRATIFYLCQPQSRNEIYSVEESSTCQYDVIVFTNILCSHPDYKSKDSPVIDIFCFSQNGSPMQPKGLESLQTFHKEKHFNKFSVKVRGTAKEVSIVGIQDIDDEDEDDIEEEEPEENIQVKKKLPPQPTTPAPPVTVDKDLVRQFLLGKFCLHGGSGWWKHEICYGKSVQQFHEVKTSSGVTRRATQITLGVWDEEKHKLWLNNSPTRVVHLKTKAKMQGTFSHIYEGGTVCDLTGKPRQVEVKLKCKETANQNYVSLYLVEPQTCQYILGVESPIVCQLLEHIDEFGIPRIDVNNL